MLRLATLGDLHGQLQRLEDTLERLVAERFDAVLMSGDFVSRSWMRSILRLYGRAEQLREQALEAVHLVRRACGVPVHWVPGNHDLPSLDGPGNVDRRSCWLEPGDGGRRRRLVGIGGAGPARFGFPYEWSDEEIEALDLPPAEVLLSHTPPLGTRDQTARGRSVGSAAIARRAAGARVLVCGHIHEARGVEATGACLVLNTGALGEPFARREYGLVHLDDDGTRAEHVDLETGRRTVAELPRTAADGC